VQSTAWPCAEELEALMDAALSDPTRSPLVDVPGLQPLMAELELALKNSNLHDYDWTFRGRIFHCSVWAETLRNHFVLVVRETAKSVFFVSLPKKRIQVVDPGMGAHGEETPDAEVVQSLLASSRDEHQIARKASTAVLSNPAGPEFVAGGLTYKLWDGTAHAFDDRRE